MKSEFTNEELKILQEIVLFQRLLDPKRKTILNHLVSKLAIQIAATEPVELDEDELDAKYRKKIVK